ncbi:glycosyltransferase family 9 protein [Magnetospirillum gryphiswaldense]|uniref:ADP-heptose:LPS heptosyltransferase n=1 Tax=Magnetospirillum gryphiswaldense TaxID=55518 RepID=A4U1B0_9PROT|nr:glycosyltransferase family 9 protein [Magnetospirillum gryphiswaldense]AVM75552.1 ADP-heptose--LPS heptosyltransferase 2 [Magnetospirillum gryphiswaldense MSR-1]AVM79455.1 ADP-heptose--LPS heptosyltransferase 2 [Magnetospirillum gryphiswaldense]CAM76667.1 ADP-heptose:LPS heptosyltransferase [Magnetospirillum gryphiswaldense MSR-1]
MRILFVTASRIGDAVLSTGLLAHLAATYPQARFTVACGAPAASLFAAAPFVEKVIPMVKRKHAGHWRDLWKQSVGTWWSLVVDLRGSALAYVVPTARRAVLKSSWEPKHRLYHLSSALRLDQAFAPVLWNTPEQMARAECLLPAGSPILALGPTANWGAKQWPAERFAQVALALTADNDGRIAVFGAENERASVQALLAALPAPRTIDLIGKVDLATVHACLKRASLYVGNDSGLMHMAAAAGIPTLGLFGPSSEIFYGPFGPHCAHVRGPRSFEDICHAPDYDYRSQECMMQDLEVGTVIAAARALLERAP